MNQKITQIAIIDRSPAAVRLIEALRRDNPDVLIHLVLPEGHLPYDETRIADFWAGRIGADALCAAPDKFYRGHGVNVIKGSKIQSVSLVRKKILTEDKQTADFDFLIVGDSEPRRPAEIKGSNKTAVYSCHSFTDAFTLAHQIPVAHSFVVQAENPLGLKAALALHQRNREVILVSSGPGLLSGWVDEDSANVLAELFREAGIRVMDQNAVVEVLGDQDLKAVRLKSGKVFAADALITDRYDPDLRLFKDSGFCDDTGFTVDAHGRTSLPHVFAMGRAARSPEVCNGWDSDATPECWAARAERIAAAIKDQSVEIPEPLRSVTLALPGHPVFIAGQPGDEVRGALYMPGTEDRLKKFFVTDGRIVGGIAVGFREDHEFILDLVRTRVEAGWVPDPAAMPQPQITENGESPAMAGQPHDRDDALNS